MREKVFALSWFILFLLLLGLAAAANYVIDPYAMFEVKRVEGVNAIKPAAATRVTTAKVYQVLKAEPGALIVGNSRPELGLDPHNACWPSASVYNTALPGQSFYRQIRHAQHAMAAGEVDTILLGLDILDFLVDRDRPARIGQGWPDSRQETRSWLVLPDGQPDPDFIWDRLDDGFRAVMSVKALADSVQTLVSQGNPDVSTRTALGFNPGERTYGGTIRNEGVAVLFRQKNKSIADRLTGQALSLTTPEGELSPTFAVLEGFLNYARLKGVRVIPFINPYHADYMLLLDRAGLWPEFDAWRWEVTTIVDRSGFGPLWDFNEFSDYTTEAPATVAAKGEALDWFWEPSHYRRELGDIMLSRMLDRRCHDKALPADFGVTVTPQTLDDRLEDLALERDLYMLAHPDNVLRLSKLVKRQGEVSLATE